MVTPFGGFNFLIVRETFHMLILACAAHFTTAACTASWAWGNTFGVIFCMPSLLKLPSKCAFTRLLYNIWSFGEKKIG